MNLFGQPVVVLVCCVASGVGLGGIFRVDGPMVCAQPTPLAIMAAQEVGDSTALHSEVVRGAEPEPVQPRTRVPSVVGLPPASAARRLAHRGLRAVARDEEGFEVDLADDHVYRVVAQSSRRGTAIERGTVVELVVRDPAPSDSGCD